MTEERVWQVRLPNGTIWVPEDSKPDDPRSSWIYARATADMFARNLGGTVVEVTKRGREGVLDQEIAAALAGKTKPPKATKTAKLKTRKRPFSREAQRKIATAILENVALNNAARSAVDTARETDNDAEHARALRVLKAGLPEALWVGYDPDEDFAHAGTVTPMWTTEDPEGGENPAHWMQIDRDEIARILVENG